MYFNIDFNTNFKFSLDLDSVAISQVFSYLLSSFFCPIYLLQTLDYYLSFYLFFISEN